MLIFGATEGSLSAQTPGLRCSGASLAGQKWAGARFAGNTSVTFVSDHSFQYTVREGARTMVSASGKFEIKQSRERPSERFPSNCQITFTPTTIGVKPDARDHRLLSSHGMLDGGEQTFWIDKKNRYVPEPYLELLNVLIWESDPGSTRNFTLAQQR